MAADLNNNNQAAAQTRIEMPLPGSDVLGSPSSQQSTRPLNRSQPPPNLDLSSSSSSNNPSDYMYFDSNTFKQVKRLYCGMLMVAMAYSVTMIIMMVVLYKTLPQSMSALHGNNLLVNGPMVSGTAPGNSKLTYRTLGSITTGPQLTEADHALEMLNGGDNKNLFNNFVSTGRTNSPTTESGAATSAMFRAHDGRIVTHETARTYLDQVIAINFLTLILYSLAFYAAHRELYTLTLAFTSTLSFTMMFSVVKIFVEGVHFPNNFMSLLLRVSIVFVALVYLGQLRRKQHFVRNLWLSPGSLLNHPVLRSSQMTPNQTAQLIREFLAASSSNATPSTAYKTEEDLMAEYQDQPPNYEEALRCPVPNDSSASPSGSIIPLRSISSTSTIHTRAASQVTLGPPPSFDELQGSRTSLNACESQAVTITVPESIAAGNESHPSSESKPSPPTVATVTASK